MASMQPSRVGYALHAATKAPVFTHGVLNGGLGTVETEITEFSSSLSLGIGLGPASVLLVLGCWVTACATAAAATVTGGQGSSKSWSLMGSLIVKGT